MKISTLGASREVGRSGFLIGCKDTNILLDYGVMFGRRGNPPKYPQHVRPKDIGGIVITHAHLDHSGYVPSLFVSGNTNVYATSPTIQLSKLLIEDMLKIDRSAHAFDAPEVEHMMNNWKDTHYREKIKIGEASLELFESGHVIGGSTVKIQTEGKSLFYTGDVHLGGSRILRKMDMDIGEIDVLITESTYSQIEQSPRVQSENNLVEFANEVMERKGILFVPSFSVERAQEIACVLKSSNFKHRVIMDGMALKVNKIMMEHPEYLREPDVFNKAIKQAIAVTSHDQRENMMKEPCVVVSPAGMLVGGNAVYYLQQLAFDQKNGIALVSYQGEGTPGKKLLEEGVVSTRGHDMNVKAEVKQFQFSGHSDRKELFEMIKQIKGNPRVFVVHGDNDSCISFADEIKEKFGLQTSAPRIGQTISV